MTSCYTNILSCRPGDRIALHAASANGPCTLEVARIGQERDVVLRRLVVDVGDHALPARPDRDGCDWPVAFEIETESTWRSGYYDIMLTDSNAQTAHHFFCLKPPGNGPLAKAAFVLATNTYHAYNWWGGANAYADVTRLMSRELALPAAMGAATGILSTQRPFAPLIVAPPPGLPRLVNLR